MIGAGMRHPGTAAVLSAIIPGIGQFYNGDFLRSLWSEKSLRNAARFSAGKMIGHYIDIYRRLGAQI